MALIHLAVISFYLSIVAAPPSSQPDDAATRDYLSANGLLNRGLYEMAAADYRKFLDSHAEHDKAHVARYGLAVCLLRMGKTDSAADELAKLEPLSKFDYAVEVATMLGQCRLAQKRYADAATLLSGVVQKHGEHDLADDAASLWIEALYRDGKQEEAIRHHAEFVTRWPKSPLRPRVEYFGGLARMAAHQDAAAAACFERLTKEYSSDPLAKEAALLLAQCLQNGDETDRAIAQYRAVLKSADGEQAADAMHGLATVLLQKGQTKEAGQVLDQFLKRFPKHRLVAAARLLRGRASFEQGKFDTAERFFEAAGEDESDPSLTDDTAYWIAKCRLKQGDAAAARQLGEAIEKYPKSDLLAEMSYDRAVALSRAGDDRGAIPILSEFLSTFAKHALAPDALYLLAACEHRTSQFAASLKHCDEFMRQFATHAMAANVAFLSAENKFLTGDYQAAEAAYRGFLDAHGSDELASNAKLRMAESLFRLKRTADAEKVLADLGAAVERDEAMRPALLMLGNLAFERSAWDEAVKNLTRYLSAGLDSPGADEALLKLGLAEARQKHHEAALRAFDRLIEHFASSPQRVQAMFERGQTLVAMKKLDEAAEVFERVLSEGRESRFAPYALNHLGAIAQQQGRMDDAAKRFEEASHASPDAPIAADASLQLAQSLLADGKYQDAEKAFASFVDQHASHPQARAARAGRAIAMSRLNRAGDAIKEIDAVEHGEGALNASLLANLRYEKAWCLRATGKEAEAAEVYRSLLESSDHDLSAQAALELADLEMRSKRFAAAAELLKRIDTDLAGSPSWVEQAAYRRAVCEYEQAHYAPAAELFSSFIKKYSKSAQIASASALCGEALLKTNRPADAIPHLRCVTEKFPDDPACGPALLRLGESFAMLQRWPESRQAFADYLERFGKSELWFQAQFGVGWADENQSHYKEAIDAYSGVIDRHKGPTAARAQFQIGECLFAENKYEPAARELLKVDILYAYPEWSGAALYEAGRCFEKLNRPADAQAQFKLVDEKYKQTHWAELARQRLTAKTVVTALPGKNDAGSND